MFRIVSFCWVGILLVIGSAVMAQPSLTLAPAEFDFGYAPQNAKIASVFLIKSDGDDSLKILRVKPGCGCTKAPLDKDEIASGDSARLEIILSTHKSKGKMRKGTNILSNAKNSMHDIYVSANIYSSTTITSPVAISPVILDISKSNVNDKGEVSFTITNNSDKNVSLKAVSWSQKYFNASLPEVIKPGESAEGILTLLDPAYHASFEKSLTFEADDDLKTRFTLPIRKRTFFAKDDK